MSAKHVGTLEHVALWDAINDYARKSCRGEDDRVYGNTARQRAVVAVERAIEALLSKATCYCGEPIGCNHEAHPDLPARTPRTPGGGR